MSRSRKSAVWVLGSMLLGVRTANGQTPEQPKAVKFIEFDHLKTDGDRAYVLNLNNGEPFQIRITETCVTAFSYEVQGILRQEPPALPGGIVTRTAVPLETKTLPIVHEDRYGGYLVTIKQKEPGVQPCGNDSPNLVSRTLMISTPLTTWDLAFSGGFTVSNLTNPHYYLRPDPAQAGKSIVLEDPSKKDDANLGIATWVQVYHHRHPWLAGTFGIGIRDSNQTEYYLGAGFRMSDKASINGGLVFGPVSRLKDGISVNDSVADPNVLTDLPTRTQRGYFIGLSYSFIDVRGKLQQPFAGAAGASGATGTTPTTNAASPAPAAAGSASAGVPCKSATFTNIPSGAFSLDKAKDSSRDVFVTLDTDGCSWKAQGVAAWLTIAPAEGKATAAPTKVTIATREANTGPARESKVEIAGKLLTITQDSGQP